MDALILTAAAYTPISDAAAFGVIINDVVRAGG